MVSRSLGERSVPFKMNELVASAVTVFALSSEREGEDGDDGICEEAKLCA